MTILNHDQISTMLKRMAIQIEEQYFGEKIYFAGINNKGLRLATLIAKHISGADVEVFSLKLNPANPHIQTPEIDLPIELLHEKNIIIIDDVGNTGRTLFYAFKAFMHILPKQVQTAVLVERMHKHFPVHVAFVGLRLATTIGDNIEVYIEDEKHFTAKLE
jgi:pyrimidine operon attenuation protein/uracil phosphoribosyltransferase